MRLIARAGAPALGTVPEEALLKMVSLVVERAAIGEALAIELLAGIMAICARAGRDQDFRRAFAEIRGDEAIAACEDTGDPELAAAAAVLREGTE
jgi:hypothetical protein